MRARGREGQALPGAIPRLEEIGVKFCRGQLSLIAGASGGGKSALALWIVSRMAYDEFRGVPAMYFSADADRLTMAKFVGAGFLNRTLNEVEQMINDDTTEAVEKVYSAVDHVWWCFDPSPDLQDINEELEAYAYVHGEYPHFIVIDNLMDIVEEESYQQINEALRDMKGLARFTGAHVLVLAHVTGEYGDGDRPIPRSAMLYKPDRKAELVMTVYRPSDGVMGLSVVKNRTGNARTNASLRVQLPWNPAMGWFGE